MRAALLALRFKFSLVTNEQEAEKVIKDGLMAYLLIIYINLSRQALPLEITNHDVSSIRLAELWECD